MKDICKILCLLMLIPLFSGCNDSDDVAVIFTGKTWKLTFIARDNGNREMYDFWGNEDKKKQSLQKLEMGSSFTVRFEGTEEDNIIQGQINGRTTIEKEFSGTWSANGTNNEFRAAVKGGEDSDILVTNFLKGLNQAESYEGDSNNLYIVYKDKEKQATFRMFFHVVN